MQLKLNLALCLWSQATEVFNKAFRRVAETKEAIANLKHSEKIFNTLMFQDKNLFLYSPSNQSKEAREQDKKDFKALYHICDEKINFVREMIQSSQQYLIYDEDREKTIQKEDEAKS